MMMMIISVVVVEVVVVVVEAVVVEKVNWTHFTEIVTSNAFASLPFVTIAKSTILPI